MYVQKMDSFSFKSGQKSGQLMYVQKLFEVG